MCSRRIMLTFLLIAAWTPVRSSAGATVTISGGFTGYNGMVFACGTQFSTINGVDYAPTVGCDSFLAAPVSVTFPTPVSTVTFTNTSNAGVTFEPSFLTFTPASPQTVGGRFEPFLLGRFTFANGIWPGDVTEIPSLFSFALTTHSDDPLLDGSMYVDALRMLAQFNRVGNTPQQNADYIYFYGHPELRAANAYEKFDSPTGTNIVSFDLFGMVDDLVPTSIGNVSGGFLAPVADPVPESSTLTLFSFGVVGVVHHLKHRQLSRRRSHPREPRKR